VNHRKILKPVIPVVTFEVLNLGHYYVEIDVINIIID
jgi:hypothetical protein